MCIIATLGPQGSDSHQAALQYQNDAKIVTLPRIKQLMETFLSGDAEYILVPVYNTREGKIKEYLHLVETMGCGYWIDNIVLPVHLSLGCLTKDHKQEIDTIVGTDSVFRQCQDFLDTEYPNAIRMAVPNMEKAVQRIHNSNSANCAIIESEDFILQHGLKLILREVVPHNKTRYAIIGKEQSLSTGYDATAFVTKPLRDRVGILSDILGEFSRRGINIIDLQSENDPKTQKLRIYIEAEGHIQDKSLLDTLAHVERKIIQEEDAIRLLGSFSRVDMRVKYIKSFGFIGSGAMSQWFADRLRNEGYETFLTGRSTQLRPEEMIANVDVVMVCVPISVTASTIEQYGHLLHDGQALIILAGESERNISRAMEATPEGVEIMFAHNLWGPQALTMKDKNVTIVRTVRSGTFSSEFEAFLYKHGAEIHYDNEKQHDLLMGVSQKLPTAISVALAMTLQEHGIEQNDISSHSTLTSIYGILAMARIHNQNPRTYAEIMATEGEGQKIVTSFIDNIHTISKIAEQGDIQKLADVMDSNTESLGKDFLQARMKQAKSVDDILGNPTF